MIRIINLLFMVFGITMQIREELIIEKVAVATLGLIAINQNTLTTLVYDDFASISQAEPFTDNKPENGEYDAGEAFTDINGNGRWDEDMGVHYFNRRVPSDAPENDLRQLRSFSVELPNTPLSYEGEILQIRWCVRVRLFMKGGREYREDHGFRLAVVSGQSAVDAGRRAPGVLLFEDGAPQTTSVDRPLTSNSIKNQSCEA